MYDCIDAIDPRTRWEASDTLSYKITLLDSYSSRLLHVAYSHVAGSFTKALKEAESDN